MKHLLKSFTVGFILDKNSYMRDSVNAIEFFVIAFVYSRTIFPKISDTALDQVNFFILIYKKMI